MKARCGLKRTICSYFAKVNTSKKAKRLKYSIDCIPVLFPFSDVGGIYVTGQLTSP